MIGSHTDSVYNGGQYDGPVGVVSGLQVAEKLINTNRYNGTIRVAIYACEESSRFGNACIGSKFLNGNITEADFENITVKKETPDGKQITLGEAIQEAKSYLAESGLEIQEVDKIFTKEDIDYSLEAHIEQYDILAKKAQKDKDNDLIGIITSIGSAVRIQYDVQGRADHTGSTPMSKRKNAADATAMMGMEIRRLGRKYEKEGLGRASQVEINTPEHNKSFNQIPHKGNGLIDIRLLGENTPDKVLEDLHRIIKKVERRTKTEISVNVVSSGYPVITSEELNGTIESMCEQEGIKSLRMPSYAGQDSGYVPAKMKTMIFIPSIGGSHNKDEYTAPEDIERATKVFTKTCENLLERQTLRDRIAVQTPIETPSMPSGENLNRNPKVKVHRKIRLIPINNGIEQGDK